MHHQIFFFGDKKMRCTTYNKLHESENKKSCMIILRETEQTDGEKYLK